jgi:hypothetical protein
MTLSVVSSVRDLGDVRGVVQDSGLVYSGDRYSVTRIPDDLIEPFTGAFFVVRKLVGVGIVRRQPETPVFVA